MARRKTIADETLDGIVFGLALAGVPGIHERREAFWRAVADDRQWLSAMPDGTLGAVIRHMKLWTLSGAFERKGRAEAIHDISMCLRSKRRNEWLRAFSTFRLV
jgi:hypothetical protein